MTAPSSMPDLPAPLQTVVARLPRLKWATHFGWTLAQRWGEDRCPLIAAALAFFGLLSVFPLALAAVAILARTLTGDAGALHAFQSYVRQFFPGATGAGLSQSMEDAARSISANSNGRTLGIVAIASLLWSGRAYFDTLAAVLNSVWPNTKPRSFVSHQVALWSTFAGAGGCFLLSSAATFALSMVQNISARLPNLFFNRQPVFWEIIGRAGSFGLTLLMFWLMFRFLPNVQGMKRRGRLAFVAAVISSVGWEGAKWAFTRFLPGVTKYQATYGSVAGVVVTMLWLYFSSLIVLLGAEVAGAWEATRALRHGEPPAELSNEDLPANQKLPSLESPMEVSKP